ncbi:hypothetical protein DPMN_194332 [Dreissena polymorpha]|uniref:Uncharacterized protein n=1 Tax=Dreissena polymorpha TaxID=45954 RepID=A0A9D3Y3H9_DREPO|nr:hypothetical protein DPMN_194332 [Dreissena polymorpha]
MVAGKRNIYSNYKGLGYVCMREGVSVWKIREKVECCGVRELQPAHTQSCKTLDLASDLLFSRERQPKVPNIWETLLYDK